MVDRFVRFACMLLAIQAVAAGNVSAQISSGDVTSDPFALLRAQARSADDGVVVEGPVDPSAYVVGPGDMFAVSIGGALPTRQEFAVGADGRLVIPEVGGIVVAGLHLSDARTAILGPLSRSFQNVSVDVSLERPRQFYVHVTGAVPLPGKYQASAVSRLDDAVQLAYAKRQFDLEVVRSGRTDIDQQAIDRAVPHPSSERPSMPADYRPSLRSIHISHTDGTDSVVDLLRYYATGDRSQNPYLLDGDVITVPTYHVSRTSIRVDGPVPFAGTYPYREGDRLTDILTIVSGSTDLREIEEVRVTSRGDARPTTKTISAKDVSWEQRIGTAQDPLLSAGDFVRITDDEIESASAFGWFNYPATYPIVGGETTVLDLVRMAGGLRTDADVSTAYIDRRQPTLLKADAQTTDLDFFSLVFFEQSNSSRRLIVDIAAILKGDAEDITLEQGDAVVVPKLEKTVYVIGNVLHPGYVPYSPNMTAGYYVEQAGGPGPMTTGIHVVSGATGDRRSGASALVASGSTVFVDREGMADTPQMQSLLVTDRTSRRQLKLATTQTIIAGVSAVAAIITTFVAISR